MFDLGSLGKWIIAIGVGLVLLGLLVWGMGRLGLPLGRLPGDVHIQGGNVNIFIPCATSVLLSLGLTVVLNLILRAINR
jgi:hypothetical protein